MAIDKDEEIDPLIYYTTADEMLRDLAGDDRVLKSCLRELRRGLHRLCVERKPLRQRDQDRLSSKSTLAVVRHLAMENSKRLRHGDP